MSDELTTALAQRDAIRRRRVSARELAVRALARIEARDGHLHAFQLVEPARTLARADAIDRAGPSDAPLAGVPVAVKDNIAVRGMPTTAGSRMLASYVPPFDATVVRRLEAAGALVVGKTVCDEFAMGSSTENSAFGPSRNPWATDRTPGGSSGGSAVAVAAGLTPLALGSDTGGSIRQPAALCGVVGVKPTYGRVSRYGLVAFASSLDQIGPIATSVADTALALEVLSGSDVHDATSAARDVPPWSAQLEAPVAGLRVGVPRHLLERGIEAGVAARFEHALSVLVDRSIAVRTIELPHSRAAIAVYYLVATAEASSNLARYDGVRYGLRVAAGTVDEMFERSRSAGFGAEVKRRIMLGTYVLSAGYYDAYYRKAQQVRTLIRDDFDRAFQDVDVVALPTSPTTAFQLGARTADPLQMYLADVFTVSASLAGLPALSVPCGLAPDGLPVGLQLIGRAWDEATILRIAHQYQQAAPTALPAV